jgi:hypothetical protein
MTSDCKILLLQIAEIALQLQLFILDDCSVSTVHFQWKELCCILERGFVMRPN